MSKLVRKTIRPPDCEEGDILKAKILGIERETSRFKDEEGNLREQLKFELELDSHYKLRAWCSFYERPSEVSLLGKLALTLEKMTGRTVDTMDELINELKAYGHIFVRCKGFRTYESEVFPNFAVVGDRLPSHQTKLQEQNA